jgi:hypothetical protein
VVAHQIGQTANTRSKNAMIQLNHFLLGKREIVDNDNENNNDDPFQAFSEEMMCAFDMKGQADIMNKMELATTGICKNRFLGKQNGCRHGV